MPVKAYWEKELSRIDREDDDPIVREALQSTYDTDWSRTTLKPRNPSKTVTEEMLSFEKRDDYGRWRKIPRVYLGSGCSIPFGYRSEPNDPDYLHPVVNELERLEEAKEYVKQFSYDTVARWLTAVTGRKIGYHGLYDRIRNSREREQRAATFRKWAVRYKRAIQAAKQIEEASFDSGSLKHYDEEGNVDFAQKAWFDPLKKEVISSQPRTHPSEFDDGTPAEEGETTKTHPNRRRPGPRRPRRTRAVNRHRVRPNGSIQT